MPAATPQQEMGLSESTLHWLEDGEQAIEPARPSPARRPATIRARRWPGRKRAVLVIGGAGHRGADRGGGRCSRSGRSATGPPPAPVPVASAEPARDADHSARRRRWPRTGSDEALDLAHLALGRRPALRRRALRGRRRSSAARNRPPKRATSTASISSWPRSARTRKRRATRWPPCRRDRDAPAASREPAVAGRAAGALCRGRAPAARVDRGGAGAPIRGPGARAILTRSPGGDATTAPRGSGCGRCCASRPRCGQAASRTIAGVDEAGMSPLAGPVAAAAVILAPGNAHRRGRRLQAARRRAARAAGADHQASARSPGRWRSPRSTRSTRSTSTGPGWRRCGARSRRWPRRRAPADRRPQAARRAAAPAAHHQGRRQEPVDRGRLDPGQDGPRRAHARARRRVPRLRLRASTRDIR